jgi:hypothetical protein
MPISACVNPRESGDPGADVETRSVADDEGI